MTIPDALESQEPSNYRFLKTLGNVSSDVVLGLIYVVSWLGTNMGFGLISYTASHWIGFEISTAAGAAAAATIGRFGGKLHDRIGICLYVSFAAGVMNTAEHVHVLSFLNGLFALIVVSVLARFHATLPIAIGLTLAPLSAVIAMSVRGHTPFGVFWLIPLLMLPQVLFTPTNIRAFPWKEINALLILLVIRWIALNAPIPELGVIPYLGEPNAHRWLFCGAAYHLAMIIYEAVDIWTPNHSS